jgi:hypothetical protein
VRAQVDRDLTTVDYFDRLLGLIKNVGRHTSISDRMIRRLAGGIIGSSDGITFLGDFFQWLAFFARPINKPPASLELPLPL